MIEPSTTPSGAPKTRLPISWIAVGIVALMILSLSLGGLTWWLLNRRPPGTFETPALPVAAEVHFTPFSLEDVGGKALASYPAGRDWTAVPQGHQVLDGVPFEVLTQLHLQGIVDATNNRLYPARTRELLLIASAPGFVSAEVNLNALDGKRFSREVSVKLEPGVRIGGFVRDSEGNPVAKAKVEILRSTRDTAGLVSIFKYGEATSNAQGKWTVREVPESLNNLLFRVTHTGFLRSEFEFSGDTGTGLLTRDALLAWRAEFKLAPQ